KVLQALADTTSVALENVQLYAELEQRVRDRTAQLEASNKELEAFSYSVSHDLRAPLRSVDGFSHALEEEFADKLAEPGLDSIHPVVQGASRMNRLIDDLLTLSRPMRAPLNRQPVNLSLIGDELAIALGNGDPGRHVEFAVAPSLIAGADPGLIRIVLENL